MPWISSAVPAVIFKISPASRTNVWLIISLVADPVTDSLNILKVSDADVSVTCTFKFTPLAEPLLIEKKNLIDFLKYQLPQ